MIIGKLSINDSVQFLSIPDSVRGSGLSFLPNLQDPVEPTGWINCGAFNHNLVVGQFGTYIRTSVTWGTTVTSCPAYMSRSLINPRATMRRVRDNFLRHRCLECLRIPSNRRNPIVNPRVHCWYDDREGPITQYFCCKILLLVAVKFPFPSLV